MKNLFWIFKGKPSILLKNALLKDYDKSPKWLPSEFGERAWAIKKEKLRIRRYEISDMGSDLTEIVRYIGGEPKTFS